MLRGFQTKGGRLALLGIFVCLALPVEAASRSDLTGLSIEELMAVEVSTASKFPQKTGDAPASVSIVTADDIRTYGYRTLADLLRGVRGMVVSYDRNYSYLGVRGAGRTGDFNGRILLLLDGYRLNDPIYDTAAIGTEFPLDMELIERVEIVRGPGASVYGSNAALAVVNVITRRGSNLNGMELSGELASFGGGRLHVSHGKQTEEGAGWLLSASAYKSDGQDLFFPGMGIAQNLDGDRYQHLFGKVDVSGLTLTAAYSKRDKDVPTAAYNTIFNDARHTTTDGTSFVDMGYEGAIDGRWGINAHLFRGNYFFRGSYPYTSAVNHDDASANWWGGEVRLLGDFGPHKLMAGVEYQDNFQQHQHNYDVAPYSLNLNDRRSSHRDGLYVQDEITLEKGLLFNAGLRYDNYSSAGESANPRLGLIWQHSEMSVLKLLYGTAFRAPNVYEMYYAQLGSGGQKANPALKPEHIRTSELVWEYHPQPEWLLTADVFANHTSDSITQITDPADGMLVFVNAGGVDTRGAELEVERQWAEGMSLRSSYAWQLSRDAASGAALTTSPRHLLKLNAVVPLPNRMKSGLELFYTGSRSTLAGATADGFWLTNLTLSGERMGGKLELSASLYNLFDTSYSDPGGEEHTQDLIAQDGRSVRVKLNYRY